MFQICFYVRCQYRPTPRPIQSQSVSTDWVILRVLTQYKLYHILVMSQPEIVQRFHIVEGEIIIIGYEEHEDAFTGGKDTVQSLVFFYDYV